MKNNKNVRKDNLSPVENGSKRIYKMYKSKKNWVVAPVVLLTLLGAVAPAPIALTNVVNATEISTSTKDDLKAKVADLVQYGLTQEQKDTALSAITSATTLETANDAVVTAQKAVVANLNKNYTDAVKDLKDTVDKSANLKDNTAVTAFKNLVSDNLDTAKGTFDTAVTSPDKFKDAYNAFLVSYNAENAKLNELKAIVPTMNDAFANFDSAKTWASNVINGLGFLTDAAKAEAVSSLLANDTWKVDVLAKVTSTISGNRTAKQTLVATVTTKAESALKAELITAEQKAQYIADANAKTTTADVQTIINELNAKLNADSLTKAKDTLLTKIDTLAKATKYTEAERKNVKASLSDIVNAATSEDALANITKFVKAATDATNFVNLNTTVEGYVKADATSLSDLDTANAKYAISQTKTLVDLYNAYSKAVQDSVAAKTKAVTDAKAIINSLTFATAVEKANYLATVDADAKDADKKASDILDYANGLKTEDDAKYDSEALTTAKKEARDVLSSLGLSGELTTATDELKDAMEKLKDDMEQHSKKGATAAEDDVTYIYNIKTAVNNVIKAKVNDTILSLDTAKVYVDALFGIDAYKDEVYKSLEAHKNDVAKLKEDVLKAVTTANNELASVKTADLLKFTKEAAIKAVNEMKYLTTAQKEDFVKQIKEALTTADVEKIYKKDDKNSKAVAVNLDAESKAKELEKYKADKIAEITNDKTGLTNLSPSQVSAFVEKIKAVTTDKSDVDAIVLAAQKANADAAKTLADFKEPAKALVASLQKTTNAAGLTEEQVKAYKDGIEDAKDLDAAKALLADAFARYEKQHDKDVVEAIDKLIKDGNYSQAKVKVGEIATESTKSEYTAKVDALLALRDKKLAALDTINGSSYLTAEEKAALAKEVSAAKDTAAVQAVLDKANEKAPATAVQLYRAYNPNSGEHLYTADKAEYDHLVSLGWKGEGNAWKAASKGAPVYRLYNPNSGEHFYTISESEYNDVAKAGWKKEGVAFYSDANKGVEVFRLFNPNAKGAGSHHYTTLASERDDLIKAGWKYENVAFFGLK